MALFVGLGMLVWSLNPHSTHAQDAANARLALVAMDLFTEVSDVRSRT